MTSSTAEYTAGPRIPSLDTLFIRTSEGKPVAVVYGDRPECLSDECGRARARLIAAAPETAKQRDRLIATLKQIRLWLAEEGCEEPLGAVDDALRAAGVTYVSCSTCQGDGEWDEGPLPARSSAQIDPEYRQVKCPECEATGRISIAVAKGGVA